MHGGLTAFFAVLFIVMAIIIAVVLLNMKFFVGLCLFAAFASWVFSGR